MSCCWFLFAEWGRSWKLGPWVTRNELVFFRSFFCYCATDFYRYLFNSCFSLASSVWSQVRGREGEARVCWKRDWRSKKAIVHVPSLPWDLRYLRMMTSIQAWQVSLIINWFWVEEGDMWVKIIATDKVFVLFWGVCSLKKCTFLLRGRAKSLSLPSRLFRFPPMLRRFW